MVNKLPARAEPVSMQKHTATMRLDARGKSMICVAAALAALALPMAIATRAIAQPNIQDLLSRPLASRGLTWRCDAQAQIACTPRQCERAAAPSIWLELDFGRQRYARCDAQGCTVRQVSYGVSGAFTTAGSGDFMLRVANDGSYFADAAGVGPVIMNTFGSCRPQE